MAALSLPPQVFAILSGLIEERAGLHYGYEDRELLAEKASVRALDAGFDSLLDYYYHLRYDDPEGEELHALVETLVVGETYFFREFAQLRVLVDEFVVPAVRKGASPRLWSAASSTGEEPLTLAMLLDDRGVLDRVHLLATDISRRSIERARAGRFGLRALRAVPDPDLAERYVGQSAAGVTVPERLRRAIEWRTLNLLDAHAISTLGTFDAILCRNVLIYFRDDTAARVVEQLSHRLVPGGVMLVGVSESLMRLAPYLDAEERGGAFVYRKVEAR